MSTITSDLANTTNALSSGTNNLNTSDDLRGVALTLFLEQLKHQDPTEPLKPSEMTQSLSVISQVEEAVKTNSNLEKIVEQLSGGNNQFGSPVSYLGKTIEYNSNYIQHQEGQTDFSYYLDQPADEVFIAVVDRQGKTVFNDRGSLAVGQNKYSWRGTDDAGNAMPAGTYEIIVTASYDGASPTKVKTSALGVVDEASFTDEGVALIVGSTLVRQENIVSVFANGATQATASSDATAQEEDSSS